METNKVGFHVPRQKQDKQENKLNYAAVRGMGGTVSFVFTYVNPDGKEVIEAVQNQAINPKIALASELGDRRGSRDLIGMFSDIANDLGATYFVIE